MHGRFPLIRAIARCLGTALAFFAMCLPVVAQAQTFQITGARLQDRTKSMLTLMGFSVSPDVTTGSLSFSEQETGNPDLRMVSLGGGFTISRDVPLYLEGTAAAARYDPTFVATNGTDTRSLPAKWNSISGTGGVGWDFRIADELVLRPIFNFSLGHLESDVSAAERVIESQTGRDVAFLERGRMNVWGVGGSLMLDYERYRPEGEIDVELRYTKVRLETFDTDFAAVKGSTNADSLALWSRWRAPTGWRALDRPVRYVLEFAHTQFLGDLRGAMGFEWLSSVGAGLELDSSKYPVIVTRTRLLVRYQFGEGVRGWALSLAASF
jgi:hypothetical protein